MGKKNNANSKVIDGALLTNSTEKVEMMGYWD